MKRRLAVVTLLLLSLIIGVASAQQTAIEVLVPEVLNVYPHDTDAFTQGLLWHEGTLYESTGQRGESTLREVDIETGEPVRAVDVTAPADATADTPLYFAEGLEQVGDQLIQLTWTSGDALVYDMASFEQVDTYEYEGEGWGLCYDDRYLFMSDGSSYISVRDADTFDLIVRFAVTLEGQVLQASLLNELECVGDDIYANLWQTDYIARIDKYSGQITGLIDASTLLTEEERAELASGSVLNGIAYNPESDTFYITGKRWPKLFEVQFVPAPETEPAG
ncbi:glutaminyl-peptide cyclotransferase [Phototrophicus methaneseepsis]|uniref:Glutaminyl-peptide cyclotransferase n=1 Tax=Phototrophicus methaneseepsis TaxID=2710758 RepID=A0A7S8IFF1_9CHLR|nr:glutaminyl-peptide cyclotransferase [Phototrophicus methaneseepsis]QPC82888.1 glutaminyl-peptide cyclotransferase [Phototrophicus methaneseepsis]